MKAIETRYKGYRFRSRLEARWAVFFDEMGLDWRYEPEGFDLGHGLKYLPDFLVSGKYYVEVKGGLKNGIEPEVSDKRKIMHFADQLPSEMELLVVGDIPESGKEHLIFRIYKQPYKKCSGHILVGNFCFWNGIIGLIDDAPRELWRFIPEDVGVLEHRIGISGWETIESLFDQNNQNHLNKFRVTNFHITVKRGLGNVIDSYDKARSARFEHGETP